MQPPEKIFAKSLFAMRNLSTFVTVVCLMQKRNQKRKKKRNLCPLTKKRKKICNKNKEEKRTPPWRRRRRRRRLRQSSTPTTPTLWWCDRERTTRTCLKKRGRFCGEFLLLAVFFFTRFVYAYDEFYGRKKNGSLFLLRANVFFCFGISEPPLCNERQDDRRGGRFGGRFGRRV